MAITAQMLGCVCQLARVARRWLRDAAVWRRSVHHACLFHTRLRLFLSFSPQAAAPNVILIISDDQGWPDLGGIGSKPLITPNLDRLAAEGVRGTGFYVTWPAGRETRPLLGCRDLHG
jgi:hypothetical protein